METSIQDKYTVSGSEHWKKKKDPATPYVTFDISCKKFSPRRRGGRGEWSADNSHRLYKPCNTTA